MRRHQWGPCRHLGEQPGAAINPVTVEGHKEVTGVKIGGFVSPLAVQCITLVPRLSASACSRKVQDVTSSQLLGTLLQCGLG
ncbi:hypothetical protein EYF80_033851 [Liparis tanakae]|uniref:Uncharacterized protein n=1 Tax=Liparis tanakae TaxID=230148 RepID=A0A4Z2GS17_9TELE|nr:hypothetical protein EYF80_033851 [Liparis tanakae]